MARLAHLHLPEDGAERLADQLAEVLRWLAGLQAVDVDGVEALDLDAVALREDVPGVVLARDEVLAGAPAVDDGQVVVPNYSLRPSGPDSSLRPSGPDSSLRPSGPDFVVEE